MFAKIFLEVKRSKKIRPSLIDFQRQLWAEDRKRLKVKSEKFKVE